MDDHEDRAMLRIHRELASLNERIDSLKEHKAGASEMNRVEQESRNGDFRVLQEVSGQISNLRTDIREWTLNSVAAAETRIMAAIKADQGWRRQLPIYISLALAVLAILSGNPHLLRYLGAP